MSIYEQYKYVFNDWKNDRKETSFQVMVFQNGVDWRKFLVELTKKVKEGDDDARTFLEELLNVQEDRFSQEYVCFEGAFYASLKLVRFIDSLQVGNHEDAYESIKTAVNLIGKNFSQGNAVGDNNAHECERALWSSNDPLETFERIFDGECNWACDAAYGWLRTLCGADGNYDERSIRTLTVKENEAGVVGTATLQKLPNGSGRLSLNLDNAFMTFETSYLESVKIACSNLIETSPNADLVWRLELGGYTAWSSPIRGGSAGSVWGLLVRALKKEERYDFSQIACTATLDEFGKLGEIDSFKEKLTAVRKENNDRPNSIRAVIVSDRQPIGDIPELHEETFSGRKVYTSGTFRVIPCSALNDAYKAATQVCREIAFQSEYKLPVRDGNFTGRAGLDLRLFKKLNAFDWKDGKGRVALYGSIGKGKTAFLTEFVWRIIDAYRNHETGKINVSNEPLFFFPSRKQTVSDVARNLYKQLHVYYHEQLPESNERAFNGLSDVDKFRKTINCLSESWKKEKKNWRQLIVVDAVDQIDDWRKLVDPVPDDFCFLVTTRNKDEVDDFELSESFDDWVENCQGMDVAELVRKISAAAVLGIEPSLVKELESQKPNFLTVVTNLRLLGGYGERKTLSEDMLHKYRTDLKLWTRPSKEIIENVLEHSTSLVQKSDLDYDKTDVVRYLASHTVARVPVSERTLERIVPIDSFFEEELDVLSDRVRARLMQETRNRFRAIEQCVRLFFKSYDDRKECVWFHPEFLDYVKVLVEKEEGSDFTERLERVFAQGCDNWQTLDEKARAYALQYRVKHWLKCGEMWKRAANAFADVPYVEARLKSIYGFADLYQDLVETAERCPLENRRNVWNEWKRFIGTRELYLSLFPESYAQEIVNELRDPESTKGRSFLNEVRESAKSSLKDRYWLQNVYRTPTRRPICASSIESIVESSDGSYFIVSDERCSSLWTRRGEWIHDYSHHSYVYDVSSDGKYVVLKRYHAKPNDDYVLRIWETTGRKYRDVTISSAFYKIKISPDGKRAIVGKGGGAYWITLETGDVYNARFNEEFQDVRFTTGSSGTYVCCYSQESGVIGVGNVETDASFSVEKSSNEFFREVVVSERGAIIVAYDCDTAIFWNVEKNLQKRICCNVTQNIKMLKLTPDGKRAVSYNDGRLAFWDLETLFAERDTTVSSVDIIPKGACQETNVYLKALQLSPDGKLAVSIGRRDECVFWNVEKGVRIGDVKKPFDGEGVASIDFMQDSSQVVICTNLGKQFSWNVSQLLNASSGKEIQLPKRDEDGTKKTNVERLKAAIPGGERLIFSRDGSIAISYGKERLCFWNVSTQTPLNVFSVGLKDDYRAETTTILNDLHVVSHNEKGNRLWNVVDGTYKDLSELQGVIVGSKEGDRVVSYSAYSFDFWDVRSGLPKKLELALKTKARACDIFRLEGVFLSDDGKRAVLYGAKGEIQFWDLTSSPVCGRNVSTTSSVRNRKTVCAPDGKSAVSFCDADELYFASASNTDPVQRDVHNNGRDVCVKYSPNSEHVVSYDRSGVLRFWTNEGKEVSYSKPLGKIRGLEFSNDGRNAVVYCKEFELYFLDVETGELINQKTVDSLIRKVAFSAELDGFISYSDRGQTLFWSRKGTPLKKRPEFYEWVDRFFFGVKSKEGKTLAAVGFDRDVVDWKTIVRQNGDELVRLYDVAVDDGARRLYRLVQPEKI